MFVCITIASLASTYDIYIHFVVFLWHLWFNKKCIIVIIHSYIVNNVWLVLWNPIFINRVLAAGGTALAQLSPNHIGGWQISFFFKQVKNFANLSIWLISLHFDNIFSVNRLLYFYDSISLWFPGLMAYLKFARSLHDLPFYTCSAIIIWHFKKYRFQLI